MELFAQSGFSKKKCRMLLPGKETLHIISETLKQKGILMRICFFLIFPMIFLSGCRSADRELAASFNDELYFGGKNTPAEFATDKVRHPWTLNAVDVLNGRKSGSRQKARHWLRILSGLIAEGKKWNQPTVQITIPRTDRPVFIDGDLSDPAWKQAHVWHGDYRSLVNEPVPFRNRHRNTGSRWLIMRDRTHLYFAGSFRDQTIVIHPKKLYRGDGFELFLLPEPALRSYWELIVAPDGSSYSGWNMKNHTGDPVTAKGLLPKDTRFAAKQTSDGFCVEIAFPLAGLPSLSGKTGQIRFMLFRTNNVPDTQTALCYDTPVPFLYDGHNLNGYITGLLIP